MKKFFLYSFATFVLLSFFYQDAFGQFYNGYSMQFGKNRVQYSERFRSFMKFKNYDTYYYLGGLELATFAGRTAQNDLEEIEKLFDYKLDGRIQFIIYNKLGDAKQSNIGLETDGGLYPDQVGQPRHGDGMGQIHSEHSRTRRDGGVGCTHE